MKKLIAISVMLALVAGAAFAQDLSIAAHTEFGTGILRQTNNSYGLADTIRFGGTAFDQFALTVSKSGDNAGGYMRFRQEGAAWGSGGPWMAHIWWQPVDIFKFKLGSGDGDFGVAKISGWGWSQQAKLGGNLLGAAVDNRGAGFFGAGRNGQQISGMTDAEWAALPQAQKDSINKAASYYVGMVNFDDSVGFYPGTGWNTWRMAFSIYPMDGLDINLAFVSLGEGIIQNGGNGAFPINDIINHTHLNVNYALSGIGTLSVSAILGTGKKTSVITNDGQDGRPNDGKVKTKSVDGGQTMKLFGSFYMNAIDNMELEFGIAYQLASKDESKATLTYPLEVGLGFTYSMGDFGVKLRGASTLMGAYKAQGDSKVKGPTSFAVDILPYYNLGSTTIYFQAGMNMAMYDSKAKPYGKNSIMGWFVNPYVKFGPGGGIDMWIGFKAWGTSGVKAYGKDKNKDPALQWAVPLTVNVWMQ